MAEVTGDPRGAAGVQAEIGSGLNAPDLGPRGGTTATGGGWG